MFRQSSIQESIITDCRDHLARQGKTRRTNMTTFDVDQDPDYAIFFARRDASGHLPERIFLQFDRATKTAWTKLPDASQKLIVSSLTEPPSPRVPSASSFASGRSPDSRQVIFQDASSPSDDKQFFNAAEASLPPPDDDLISGL